MIVSDEGGDAIVSLRHLGSSDENVINSKRPMRVEFKSVLEDTIISSSSL